MSRIDGIRLKIQRAKNHIDDLEEAIRAFIKSKPYTIGTKPHPVAEIEHTTLFVSTIEQVPFALSLIVGDAVHNLRSSLDHLAWQLVEAGGGIPNTDTYFPICETAHQFASAIGRGDVSKMRTGAESVVLSLQPCTTGDTTLVMLNELDRIDKHRLLIAVASTMDKWGVDVFNGQTMWFNENRFLPLAIGYEIANIPNSTYAQSPQAFKLSIDVTFGKPEIAEGNLVLETVQQMADQVDAIVNKLEPFLA